MPPKRKATAANPPADATQPDGKQAKQDGQTSVVTTRRSKRNASATADATGSTSQDQNQKQDQTQAQSESQPSEEKPSKGKAAGKGKGKAKAKAKDTAQTDDADDKADEDDKKDIKADDDEDKPSKGIKIRVDEGFTESTQASVFIDPGDGSIHDATLNQTNVGANNNKFYLVQLLTDGKVYWCYTRWGRLGEFGQKKSTRWLEFTDAKRDFDKKFKDKTGLRWVDRATEPKFNKYTYLERNYEDDSDDDDEHKDDDNDNEKGDDEGNNTKIKKEEEEEPEPDSKLDPRVKSLVELIFNEKDLNYALKQMGYNADKLPLGKLSNSTLLKGFEYLQNLEEVIRNANAAQTKHGMTQSNAIHHFTNRYYSTIPHIGFNKRERLPLIDDLSLIKNEIDMLDNLTNMGITNKIMQETGKKRSKKGDGDGDKKDEERIARVDQQFAQLKLDEATPLDENEHEYEMLQKYLVNTAGYTHNLKYKIKGIFRIDRNGEGDRFDQSYGKYANSCRRLLWHGSRTSNYGGILSQGLRIAPPEAPVSGYMFGKGIYLADISSKSANYCFSGGAGSLDNLIMVCEAELGDPALELVHSDYNAGEKAREQKSISTKGLGRTVPTKWTDASVVNKQLEGILMPDPDHKPDTDGGGNNSASLQYNEYIVYDVAQVRIRYLIRFKEDYS